MSELNFDPFFDKVKAERELDTNPHSPYSYEWAVRALSAAKASEMVVILQRDSAVDLLEKMADNYAQAMSAFLNGDKDNAGIYIEGSKLRAKARDLISNIKTNKPALGA